jgi:site-specific DNA-methyltransferase (adenine-specific)
MYGKKKPMNYENTDGMYHPHSVIKQAPDAQRSNSSIKNKPFHPTQKPLHLCEWLVKTYSNDGETVFDGFMGSGSSGVSALNNNRKFIGCELDLNYFEMAKKRIDNSKLDLMSYAHEAC